MRRTLLVIWAAFVCPCAASADEPPSTVTSVPLPMPSVSTPAMPDAQDAGFQPQDCPPEPCPPEPCLPEPYPMPVAPARSKIRVIVPPPKITYRQAEPTCEAPPACPEAAPAARQASSSTVTTTFTAPFTYAMPFQTHAYQAGGGFAANPMFAYQPNVASQYGGYGMTHAAPFGFQPGVTPLMQSAMPVAPASLLGVPAAGACAVGNDTRAVARIREQVALLAELAQLLNDAKKAGSPAVEGAVRKLTDEEITRTLELLAGEIQKLKVDLVEQTAMTRRILTDQDQAVIQLDEEVSRIVGELKSVSETIRELKSEDKRLELRIEELVGSVDGLKTSHQDLADTVTKDQGAKIKELESEIGKLKEKIAAMGNPG